MNATMKRAALDNLTDCPMMADGRHEWVVTTIPALWINGRKRVDSYERAQCRYCYRTEVVR